MSKQPEEIMLLEKQDNGTYTMMNGYLEVLKSGMTFDEAVEWIESFGKWDEPYIDIGGFEMRVMIDKD